MREASVWAAQLRALRASVGVLQSQIDALAALIEDEVVTQAESDPPACRHEDATFVGTLGAPEYRCRCGWVGTSLP